MTINSKPSATVAPTIRFRARPGTAVAPPALVSREDDVGYGRPPKQHRFKPGQSGNPRGRPKGARGFKTMVSALLEEPVTIRTPRGKKRVTVIEVMLRRQIEQGSQGDHRAILSLLKLYQSVSVDPLADATGSSTAPDELTDSDALILAEFRRMVLAEGAQ